ncbi:MAG TPA: phospholipase D family protein [Acetobacteraceae bacterium]|nr:phospholipase D family protein [Acetobacteraceae bacterium]
MVRHSTGLCDSIGAVADLAAAPSGVSLVSDNLAAFALRALSARAAIRSLDLLYYFWEEDVTGRLLARELLQAADRGVRVRLLLDDLYVRGSERVLATLAQHPSVEVRLFNPFQVRSWGALGNAVEFLFAGYRLNHRMHNKAWIVDGQLVIGGGRNIGDEYFDASSQFNFRDLDLVVTGAAATQAVEIFNRYWTHRRVRPLGEVGASHPLDGGLDELRRTLDAAAASTSAAYLERVQTIPDLAGLLAEGRVAVDAHKLRIVADPPGKGHGRHRSPGMLNMILDALRGGRARILLISPYLVPGRRGTRFLTALARRGVDISILTNSLAATDVLAVHGRYARYRRRLLRAGIALHELKRGGQEGRSLFGSGGASLHTKAFGVDDELIFVGSFNFDPRSATLNTEMGAFVENAVLAGQLREEHERLSDPARSWRVSLVRGRVTWSDRVEGTPRKLRREPGTTLMRRILARVLGWLPIEPLL